MKRLIVLFLTAIAAFMVVVFVALTTSDKTKYNNDFVRIFPPHAADINTIINTQTNHLFLVGLLRRDAYLRDRKGILFLELYSKDTTRIELETPFGSEVAIDSPFFFVHNGGNGTLKRGDLFTWKIDTTFDSIPGFTAIQMMSGQEGVIRKINISKRQNSLERLDGSAEYVLEKQIDGLLCTDGILQYSRELNQLVYVYRYRNQFVCLDSCLNVIRYGKTIDTTSVAKISVAEIDGKITMAKPPLAVNNDARVSGRYLFVQSNLVARNEAVDKSKERTVIDVYNITDGSYRYSFYIDNYEGSKMLEFDVANNTLIATFPRAIITYDLPSKYLP